MKLTVQGVITDGSTPVTAQPTPSPVSTPAGVDVTVVVPVVGQNGQPIPLAGYTAPTLTIKTTPTATTNISQVTGTMSGSALTFLVPGSALKAAGAGAWHWDVFITNPSGNRDEPVVDSIWTVTAADGA